MMRIAFAALLALHGIAHGVGFASAWGLGDVREATPSTTLLDGRLEIGLAGTRALGIVWLLTGLGFLVAGAGAWRRASWWPSLTVGISLLSLGLSVLEWPEARIGVGMNAVILAVVYVFGRRLLSA